MRAMVLEQPGTPLQLRELPTPEPGPGEIRLRVEACGVCRTDLHVVDGELPEPALPLVPGHQIVGTIDAIGEAIGDANGDVTGDDAGSAARRFAVGDRVGVPWLGKTCGQCRNCLRGKENT